MPRSTSQRLRLSASNAVSVTPTISALLQWRGERETPSLRERSLTFPAVSGLGVP